MRARLTLSRFFDLPEDSRVEAQVRTHFRRNFMANALDMAAWLLGESFVSIGAILPVYARHLTDSPVVIGMIPALTDAGWFLPQLFMAAYVERLRSKKSAVLFFGALERLPFLALPLIVLWIAGVPRTLGVAIFLVLMVWKSFASGLSAAPWQELMATVIPVSHRGRFFGVSRLGGQLIGIGGAAVAAVILARLPYPRNFAACFALGALGVILSYAFFLWTIEPSSSIHPAPQHSLSEYLGRLKSILHDDRNLRSFILSRYMAYFGGMAYGFMAVYAVQRFGLDDASAGVFTAILLGSSVVGLGVWGPLGDHLGHKRVLEMAGTAWLLALVIALVASGYSAFYLVFGLMGFGTSGTLVSDLAIAMEFGPVNERPTYVGLLRTLTGPAVFFAPLAAGALVQWLGYLPMFVISLVLALCGLLLLWRRVVEPRALPLPERSILIGPPE
jgi:MFS family permease